MQNAHHSSDITTYYGSVVYYTCESRFTMVGDRSYSTCLASGTWISPDFECVRKYILFSVKQSYIIVE